MEEAHSEADTSLPVLVRLTWMLGWRQSMSVDLNAFVQPPISKRQRQKRSRFHSTDSIVGEVEKENLLEAFDLQINAADSINQPDIDATVD